MSRDDELIADYLLGELSHDAARAVEERAARDAEFADALRRMRPVVVGLEALPAEAWSAAEPPPLPPVPGLDPPRAGRRAWSALPRPALALAVVVLALAVVGVTRWGSGGEDGQGPALALAPLGDAGPAARGEARTVGDGAALSLSVSGLRASGPGSFYELWLLDDPEHLVSLGSFRVPAEGAADIRVPLPVSVGDFAFIDVSVEADDGDPAHSGISVLRGAVG